jgi:hypothetical protein
MSVFIKEIGFCSFDVPDAERQSIGYTVYKIVLHVNPKELADDAYQLLYRKRYPDIEKLHDALLRYHRNILRTEKFPDLSQKTSYFRKEHHEACPSAF